MYTFLCSARGLADFDNFEVKHHILTFMRFSIIFSISLIEQLRFDVNKGLVMSQCPIGMMWENLLCVPKENFVNYLNLIN